MRVAAAVWLSFVYVLNSHISAVDDEAKIVFVILNQPTDFHRNRTNALRRTLADEFSGAVVYDTANDFPDVIGSWAIWPLLSRLSEKLENNAEFQNSISRSAWLFFCEDGTIMKPRRLKEYLKKYNVNEPQFIGHALRDRAATIIHHFAFAGQDASKFAYPDFAAGFAISWPLLEKILSKLRSGRKPHDFTIDAKHELAMLIWENGAGLPMTDSEAFCTTKKGDDCVTEYPNDEYRLCPISSDAANDNVMFGVKTFHQHHKTRIVVVKRTWALHARNIEYFSDTDDQYIPTINLGLNNTERGHCGKTIGIFKYFAEKHAQTMKWLVIVDDDTILSVSRLLQLLNCYDASKPLIIGERYAYGFDVHGDQGYDYPTGGAGMIFTRSAVLDLVDRCQCPSADSPDDMIIGICARSIGIPIVHSSALHQARPDDYADDYLRRTVPISFHKHWEIDPYAVYSTWLSEKATSQKADEKPVDRHIDEL